MNFKNVPCVLFFFYVIFQNLSFFDQGIFVISQASSYLVVFALSFFPYSLSILPFSLIFHCRFLKFAIFGNFTLLKIASLFCPYCFFFILFLSSVLLFSFSLFFVLLSLGFLVILFSCAFSSSPLLYAFFASSGYLCMCQIKPYLVFIFYFLCVVPSFSSAQMKPYFFFFYLFLPLCRLVFFCCFSIFFFPHFFPLFVLLHY